MVLNHLIPRLLAPPKGSFFLFGPRGCGKSTWLKQHFADALQLSLLDETLYQSYLARPGLFHETAARARPGQWVVLDEVQRLPSLLNEVHRLIEGRKIRFALTGSSARKLRRAGVNLLAGRAVPRRMYPLTPMELGAEFDLSSALRFGTLPLVLASDDPRDTLTGYSRMYLKEEIQAEALVRNLPGFSRFLPVAALFHGQALNISNVARDAEVSRPTVQGFFGILEDTLLASRLPAFTGGLRVREKAAPKFYWVDPGIVRAARKTLDPPGPEELGPLFEGLVFMMLEFQRETWGDIDEIHYWSPAEAKHTEVDFLVTRGKERIAIEVKATTRPRPEHFKGLKAIAALPGVRRRILVHPGDSDRLVDGMEILGFRSFVAELAARRI